MYANLTSQPRCAIRGCVWLILACGASASMLVGAIPRTGYAQQAQQIPSVVHNISQANERLEMIVNTSQILTLGTRIPRIVVNNPDLVEVRPISDKQVQIAARKSGVTQINLWDENGQIYTVDLLIFGDVRELEVNLKRMFPSSSIRVVRLTNSLVLEGQVDRPEIVTTIRTLAEDYAPKVINNMTVGGAQQILLKVKVMEISRTKLRDIGFDFDLSGTSGFLQSTSAGVLSAVSRTEPTFTKVGSTIDFQLIDGNTQFLGVLQALQQNNVIKTLADPTLVTVSGRPASFNSGGEIFFQVTSSQGTASVESEKFGTQVDFVPIVLGDGRIRLEIRPKISSIDNSNPIADQLFRTKVSEVDTGVEMRAGQTLAIAGLIQTKVKATHRGLPYISDVPYLGVPFRRVTDEVEEVELLILVTPEFAEAMDPHEVPPCGPGMETMSPSNCELYFKGHIEVPACGPCGASQPCVCNAPGLACQQNGFGPCGGPGFGEPAMATDASGQMGVGPTPMQGQLMPTPAQQYEGEVYEAPVELPNPAGEPHAMRSGPMHQSQSSQPRGVPNPAAGMAQPAWQTVSATSLNPASRHNPTPNVTTANRTTSTPGLIGPIGYDVQK
ncbi:MAG: pilus assembly protein N-terminal domain-containing protein [Pirellulales bacterium]|nr:pilus assembly protein N-terminal domain-containing protein [Pirellulales bacterium]